MECFLKSRELFKGEQVDKQEGNFSAVIPSIIGPKLIKIETSYPCNNLFLKISVVNPGSGQI